jgi:hypothetical protein
MEEMAMTRAAATLIAGIALLGGCTSPPSGPPPIVPKAGEPAPPVVRRPVTEATAPATSAPTVPGAPEPALVVPPGALYACVVGYGDKRIVTAIQFEPKIAALCAKHPEMGPCQYEREGCRRGGGRVFDASGKEITQLTEAEYDRRVMRLRFRAD